MNIFNQAKIYPNQTVYFCRKNLYAVMTKPQTNTAVTDSLILNNISCIVRDEYDNLERIFYKKPIPLIDAFKGFVNSMEPYLIHQIMLRYRHSPTEIDSIIADLSANPKLGQMKVKSLYGIGTAAFAFQLDGEKNRILKVSNRDHYPNGRSHAYFDVPTYEKGRLSKRDDSAYYYIEKMLSPHGISKEDMDELCDGIRASGYILDDIYEIDTKIYLKNQFGKDENGAVYLLDPECAVKFEEPEKSLFVLIVEHFRRLVKGADNQL